MMPHSLFFHHHTNTGHNLGLYHPFKGGVAYADKTGMMGRPQEDDDTRKCFNSPNSWQLGWYQNARVTLDFTKQGGFKGRLLGINDYSTTEETDGDYVHIRIESGVTDFYIGFNLKEGINADTTEDGNFITVHSQPGEDASDLLVLLSAGESFQQDGEDWTLTVGKVDFSANPPFAEIEIIKDGCNTLGVCTAECNECCADSECSTAGDDCVVGTCNGGMADESSGGGGRCAYDTSNCPGNFAMSLTTSPKFFKDTYWILVDECDNDKVVLENVTYTAPAGQTFNQTAVLPPSQYNLRIFGK
jgi:hypothetical protein